MASCHLCPITLAYATVGFLILNRLYVYRYLRPYQGLIIFAFIVYRANQVSSSSISVDTMSTILDTISNGIKILYRKYQLPLPVIQAIGDWLGILTLLSLVNFLNFAFLKNNLHGMKKDLTDWGFQFLNKNFSFVKETLAQERTKLEASIGKELKQKASTVGEMNTTLPNKGMSHKDILALMSTAVEKENVVWETGHLSGSVYLGSHEHREFLNKCFGFYSLSNALHPDLWPSVMKFDSEIISMTANLVNHGNPSICGCTTSGGTESIILAIKAHRDYWRDQYGITEPEMIAAKTAHAAVEKACDMLKIKLIQVDVDPITFRLDLRALKRNISPNTIMMYSSAPTYPHGSIDPIREMSQFAQRYNIGLHVDCCLGGFVLPFARKAGFKLPGSNLTILR